MEAAVRIAKESIYDEDGSHVMYPEEELVPLNLQALMTLSQYKSAQKKVSKGFRGTA